MKIHSNPFLKTLALAAITLTLGQTASAVDYYWNTTTAGSWGTATNWSNNATTGGTTGVVPGAADRVFFNQSSVNGAEIITLDGARSITGLTFNNTGTTTFRATAAAVTNQTLTLGTGGITMASTAGNVLFSQTPATYGVLTIATGATTQVWTNNATSLTAGPVTGSGQLTLTGANASGNSLGQFALDLSAYTGNIVLNNSRLANSVAANGFGTTGTILVNSGAQLIVNTASTTNARAVTINGDGWFDNTVQRGAIRFLQNGDFSNTVTLGSASRVFTDSGRAGTFSGRITGGFGLTIGNTAAGPNGSITFSGATTNDYSGLTTVSAGSLLLNKTAGVNAIAGNVLVTSSGTLSNSANDQIANTATVSVDSNVAVWTLNAKTETIDTLNLSGAYAANKGFVTGGASSLTVTNLNVSGGGVTLNSSGAGNQGTITANTVTNTGGTWVFGTGSGTQSLVIGSGGLTIGGASIMDVAGVSNFISLGGNVTSQSNATVNTISGAGQLRLNATRTFDVANGAAASDLTISAILANGTGTGGVLKTGAGLLTLSGINTYSGGTQIDTGTLTLGHATNTLADAGSINVNGGILALGTNTETVGAVTLTSGSITGSGTAAQGVLTGSSYDVRSGSVSAKLAGGSVNMVKSTSDTVTLSGANTFTGSLTIKEGTILSTNSTAITTASSLILGDSTGLSTTDATFDMTTANVTYANPINVVGTNQVNTIKDSSFTLALNGPITLTNANLTLNQATTAAMTVSGGVTGSGVKQDLIISSTGSGGALALQTGAVNMAGTITNNGSGASATNISSVIGTNVTGVTQNSASSTLTLSGANTYTTTTTIAAGILNAGIADGVGTGALGNGGMITFTGGRLQYSAASAGTDYSARIKNSSAAVALDTNSHNVSLGGIIDNSNTLGLTKTGSGTLTLSGANTFTGNVSISAGNLVINNSEALGTSATTKTVTITATGNKFLDLDSSIAGGSNITLSNKINYTTSGINGVIRNIAGNNVVEGTITMAVGNGDTKIISNGGSLTLAGTVTANTSGRTLDLGGSSLGDNTVSGVINNSSTPSLRKTDAGKWILTNANTFAGTTKVDGGTLVLKNNLAIQNSAFDTSSAGTLDLADASINELTIGGLIGDGATGKDFILPANVTSLTLNQSGSVSYSKNFSGGATGLTLTKSGSGTQILSGSNSYSGTTTISGGVLAIAHENALGTSTAINVTNVAANTLRIDVPDSTSTTVGTGKTVTVNNSGLNFHGALQSAASINATWAGNVVIGTSNARIGGGDSGTLTINGVISETTPNTNVLFSRAANSTTILGNVNTYIGDTQLFMNGSTVTLKMGIANAISSSSRVTVSSSTTGTGFFDLNGFNQNVRALADTVGGDLVVTNSSSSADAELQLTSTDAQSFNGWIQDGATRKTSLLITGTGSQTLSGVNTHTGGTRIDSGTLTLGHATNTLVDAGAVEITGGTLALGTNSDTVGAVTLTNGSITGSGAGTLTGTGSNFDVRSGTISAKLGGLVGLDKTTSGTVTISSDNSTGGYTGATTVSAGTLIVDGNISTSSLTTVNGTGILSGSGTLGSVTIAATGTHSPGNSPGIVNTGDYTMAGSLNIEAIGNTAGIGGHDQVNVTGVVNLSGTLNTQFTAGTYVNGNLLFFLLNDGTDAITGTFNNLAQGAIVTNFGGFDWQISYNANGDSLGSPSFTGGNDVALMAIPEPSSALLSGLASLLLLRRRRTAA